MDSVLTINQVSNYPYIEGTSANHILFSSRLLSLYYSTLHSFNLFEPTISMAVGKNKRLSKGKKGIKKKVVDPFTRKGESTSLEAKEKIKDVKLTTCFFSRPTINSILFIKFRNFDIPTSTIQTGTISRLPLSSRSVMSERPSSTDLRD